MASTIVLAFRCFWPSCAKGMGAFSSGQDLRKHLATAHGFDIPNPYKSKSRRRGTKRLSFVVLKATKSLKGVSHSLACAFCAHYTSSCATMHRHTCKDHAQYWPAAIDATELNDDAPALNDDATEATDDATALNDDATEATDNATEATDNATEATDDATESNDDATLVTDDATEATTQRRGQKRSSPSTDVIEVDDIDCTPPASRFIVGSLDVTDAIHRLRTSIAKYKWKLCLESNLPLALALSHMLLLIPGEYDSYKPFMDTADVQMIAKHINDTYDITEPAMPFPLVVDLLRIVEDLRIDAIQPADAALRFAALSVDISDNERKIIKAIGTYVERLPVVPTRYPVSEATLAQFYAAPLLEAMFIDRTLQVVIYYTNTQALEVTDDTVADLFLGRPDLCIQRDQGAHAASTHGYGEIKPSESSNRYGLAMDLYRVAILCARALREHGTRGTMGIQVAGFSASFYLVVCPSPSVQVMTLVATVNIPRCLKEIRTLITEIPALLMVLKVFKSCCLASSLALSSPEIALPVASHVQSPSCASSASAESSRLSCSSRPDEIPTPTKSPPLLSETSFTKIFSTVRNKKVKCVLGSIQR